MRVFSNLAISLDGKIADRHHPTRPLGTPYDRKRMQEIRGEADAIIVGAETLRAHPHTYNIKNKTLLKRRGGRQPVNVILTRSGKLDPSAKFWDDPSIIRFVFTTRKGFLTAQKIVGERAFVEIAGEENVIPGLVLARLEASGLNQILIEGGGEIMSLFLKHGLVSDMYVTLTPWLLGGKNNPTLVGGEGLVPWTSLQINKFKKVKNEIYFHYRIRRSK